LSGTEENQNKNNKRQKSEEQSEASKSENIEFNLNDVENLVNNFEKRKTSDKDCVDILLTNQWPKYVEKQSGQQLVCFYFIQQISL
jgi:hypothetical protein